MDIGGRISASTTPVVKKYRTWWLIIFFCSDSVIQLAISLILITSIMAKPLNENANCSMLVTAVGCQVWRYELITMFVEQCHSQGWQSRWWYLWEYYVWGRHLRDCGAADANLARGTQSPEIWEFIESSIDREVGSRVQLMLDLQ